MFVIFSVGVTYVFSISGITWRWAFIVNGLFLVVSLLDLLFIPKKDKMIFQRVIRHEMERGITYTGKISLQNASSHTVNIRLKEAIPQSFQAAFPLYGSVEGKSA